MTYTPPEGVSIGDFTADTLPASFNAPVGAGISYKIYGTAAGVGTATSEGEPEGYKIPILNTSGVTENICNGTESVGGGYGKRLYFDKDKISSSTSILYVSINSGSTQLSNVSVYLNSTYKRAISGSNTFTFTIYLTAKDKSDIKESKAPYIRIYKSNTYMTVISEEMITLATPPDHYIPHRYESNYDLFIGNTKLGAEEYVDYAEQKIYKMSGSTLVPTDPPVSFPTILTYKGKNTLSSTETLGEVELTGDWLAIMGSTQSESIDIGFTVDADEYIAFATVDDGPSIQVSDTITMPSSADSFTLEVVSWGRERYTETVYSALS